MGQIDRLPSHFPAGTRYIIEGRAGRILLQRLEFPDGRQVDLPTDPVPPPAPARRRMHRRRAKKLS
jgi:hypothetical protein